MAKAISNIFNELKGTLKVSEKLTFRMHRSKIVIEKHPQPSYTRTEAQDAVRNAYRTCCDEWNALTEEEKAIYEEKARELNLTAFNVFLSECIKNKLTAPPPPQPETINNYELKITEAWES